MEKRRVQFIGQACKTESIAEKYCNFSLYKFRLSMFDSQEVFMKQREGMESMLKPKVLIAVGSLIGVFVIIYGTAAVYGLLLGSYLFDGGLTNLNYALLATLCAVPFVLVAVMGRKGGETTSAVLISALLFSVLFTLVQLVLVLSAEAMDGAAGGRVLATFPISALLLVGALYLTRGREKAV